MNKIQEIIDEEEKPAYWSEIAKIDFACLLNEKMNKHEINCKELANKSGVSISSIKRILSGEVNFTLETIVKLMFGFEERVDITSEPLKIEHIPIEKLFECAKSKVDFQQPEYDVVEMTTTMSDYQIEDEIILP